MTPTDVLDRPAWKFWMDSGIRAAGVAWENEQKRQARSGSTTGAATQGQQEDLVEDQERRADRREAQDGTPSLSDQMDAIEDIEAGRGDPIDGRDPSGPTDDGQKPPDGGR